MTVAFGRIRTWLSHEGLNPCSEGDYARQTLASESPRVAEIRRRLGVRGCARTAEQNITGLRAKELSRLYDNQPRERVGL